MRMWRSVLCAALALGTSVSARAQLESEELYVVDLPETMSPHWIWVNDVSFMRPLDSRAYLIDADTGAFKGMISGGYVQGPLQIARDGKSFSIVSTYYSRGSRGERTDVVTSYDMKNLAMTGEVIIPPKQMMSLPLLSKTTLTDDSRFLLIYNFTPEQSVSVVDQTAAKFVGETGTPGCALIYPAGPRRFFMQCGDGRMQTATLAEDGVMSLGAMSAQLFDEKDPANEKPVRIGDARWLFTTFDSEVRIVDWSAKVPAVKEKWSLIDKATAEWRIGGLQPSAYHAASGKLYTLMHVGGRDTHKDPGTEVWVYDVKRKTRIQRIVLDQPATSIAVSADDKPLLYTVMFGVNGLDVYDAIGGGKLRTVGELGDTLSILQPAPVIAENGG